MRQMSHLVYAGVQVYIAVQFKPCWLNQIPGPRRGGIASNVGPLSVQLEKQKAGGNGE